MPARVCSNIRPGALALRRRVFDLLESLRHDILAPSFAEYFGGCRALDPTTKPVGDKYVSHTRLLGKLWVLTNEGLLRAV